MAADGDDPARLAEDVTPFAPRTIKGLSRSSCSSTAAFMDTTSLSFTGAAARHQAREGIRRITGPT
jgi:hypothetical protein